MDSPQVSAEASAPVSLGVHTRQPAGEIRLRGAPHRTATHASITQCRLAYRRVNPRREGSSVLGRGRFGLKRRRHHQGVSGTRRSRASMVAGVGSYPDLSWPAEPGALGSAHPPTCEVRGLPPHHFPQRLERDGARWMGAGGADHAVVRITSPGEEAHAPTGGRLGGNISLTEFVGRPKASCNAIRCSRRAQRGMRLPTMVTQLAARAFPASAAAYERPRVPVGDDHA